MTRIALIEDEPSLAMGISDNLELEGYECDVYDHGTSGMEVCLTNPPDLLILDLGLPGTDGLMVLEKVRAKHADLPILVLTARSSEVDVLKGFRKGASDYVTKPFSPRILLARVAALLERYKPKSTALFLGETQIDLRSMTSTGSPLTTKEYEVLALLAEKRGEPVSRMVLLEEVWGMDSNASDRAVDTLVSELRKKVEPNPARPVYIITQRGIGYKLATAAFSR